MSAKLHPDLKSEIAAIAADIGCEVFDLAFDGQVLRIMLDRVDGGVTLEDCTSVSRQVSAYLDVNEFGSKRYTLEVSSPGLDRPLRGPDDYQRFLGHLAHVTYVPTSRRSKKAKRADAKRADAESVDEDRAAKGPSAVSVIGRLETFDETTDGGTVVLIEPERDVRHAIPVAQVKNARLEIEL